MKLTNQIKSPSQNNKRADQRRSAFPPIQHQVVKEFSHKSLSKWKSPKRPATLRKVISLKIVTVLKFNSAPKTKKEPKAEKSPKKEKVKKEPKQLSPDEKKKKKGKQAWETDSEDDNEDLSDGSFGSDSE